MLLAIPSPDLVINLFASTGQVLGLLSVLAGGLFVSRRQAGGAPRQGPKRGTVLGLGGLLAATVVGFVLFYMHVEDAKQQRLRANLVRPSTEAGKVILDPSLKELSFSGQLVHPRGLSTEALAAAIAKAEPLNLIDVRETEEIEAGRIHGSWHVRYPDIQRDKKGLVMPGKRSVLICYSGNRSSELVNEFVEQGFDCSFMIGGYEKWIAEGRDLDMTDGRPRRTLRDLPAVPNDEILLDTPDVADLVADRKAIFVDVRYPFEFAAGHLPGAINLTMRKLCSPELEAAIQALPQAPIIVPCYDKRSSFYASLLAVRLHRAGRDFLGRYTVPHEYMVAPVAKGHVAAWEAQRKGRSLFAALEETLAVLLVWLRDQMGSLVLAILGLVVLLRGVFLPLGLKADRDRWRRAALAPEILELRQKHAGDPAAAQQAVLDLMQRAGLTPLRNMLVSMAQLFLFLAFFGVVGTLAATSSDKLFGLWPLAKPDVFFVLPIAVGLLMAAIAAFGGRTRRRLVVAVVAGAGIAALCWTLPVATNLYLVASLLFVLGQSWLARALEARRGRGPVDPSARGVLPLMQAAHARGAGNKAIRLARMLKAGLPVPDGFAITEQALARATSGLTESDRLRVVALHRRLGAARVAVRSSGLNEDGSDRSYAGVFESRLGVGRGELLAAVDDVRRSLDSARAKSYGGGNERGGIVVQAMVEADWSGVMFTEHPATAGASLIELVQGLGEQLVSGQVTPQAFRYARVTGRPLDAAAPPIDLTPLLALGRQVEKLFGRPQDIEWAYAGGRFWLLQARDITTQTASGTPAARRERQRARLLEIVADAGADEEVFVQNELSELLPAPTPLSLALMNELWAKGGSVDLACRSLGIRYDVRADGPDYVVDVFGALFVDRREERRRLARSLGAMASFRLARAAPGLESAFQSHFLPSLQRRLGAIESSDLTKLSEADLFALWRDTRRSFVTSTYVEAERLNIAADFYVKTAGAQLRRSGLDPAVVLAGLPATVVHRAFGLLPAIRAGREKKETFLALFGHRARHDFELAERRYAEDAELVAQLVASARDEATPPQHAQPAMGPLLTACVERARRFQTLKEEAKHEAMRELAVLRAIVVEIGRRFELGERVFWLLPAEIDALATHGLDVAMLRRSEERREVAEACAEIVPPTRLTLHQLETLALDGGPLVPRAGETLSGLRVAGDGEVVGRVRVVRDVAGLAAFEAGEILVTRFTDPAWAPVFPVAGGLVTEVGGWLSHAAIQAREYGLPCIVGATGALTALSTGDLVRLGRDGSIALATEDAVAGDRILNFRPAAPAVSNGLPRTAASMQ